jgi:hypothetical protein
MLDSWVHASIESRGVTETSKVIDVMLPLGRKQHSYVQEHMLCLYYTLCLMQLSVVCNLICSWIAVYYFVIMPRVNFIVIFLTYARYLYSINCPTVICLPNMCYLSHGETPLVNCGPRSNFL